MKNSFVYDATAKMYQNGLSREEAMKKGADMVKFDALEIEFKGGSIPLHILRGFAYKAPYSCDFHTGGNQGKMLRDMIAKHNKGE
jgi:hypothetical protein